MADMLKGNFTPKANVEAKDDAAEDTESRFEREAIKHLGGSVAFVAKQRVNWDLKEDKD